MPNRLPKGRHLPNMPDNSFVTPEYSLNSGNGPIDSEYNNNPMTKKLTRWAKKNKNVFKK
jgi:hypothetical protein